MIERLPWDSEFFGYEVGKVQIEKGLIGDLFLQEAQNFQLVYIYSPDCLLKLPESILHIDTRLSFSKKIHAHKVVNSFQIHSSGDKEGVVELPRIEATNKGEEGKEMLKRQESGALINLALLSGKFSRFKIDKRLGGNEFERLYTQWIGSALEGPDRVLVYKIGNAIRGLITFLSANSRGRIGLIAVEEAYWGKKMGTQLLRAAMEVGRQEGLHMLEIETQKKNQPAIALYQKNGFHLAEKTEIYHWWK